MPLVETIRAVYDYTRDERHAYAANNQKLLLRTTEVLFRTWDLGFTAFGGPPVHFQILYRRFVEGHGGKQPWIDEQTYQEIFALCQGLPGPASTKMLFLITLIHAGFLPALLAFFLWSLPGAVGMFGLSLGVRNLNELLPGAVYALLSGMNASTVGIIALAAVQLAEKAVHDNLSRILVIFGGCAGLCYNALWYFPILISAGGITTVLWEIWLRRLLVRAKQRWRQRQGADNSTETNIAVESVPHQSTTVSTSRTIEARSDQRVLQRRAAASADAASESGADSTGDTHTQSNLVIRDTPSTDMNTHGITLIQGCVIIFVFLASFVTVLVLSAVIVHSTRVLDVFRNMYLAGFIIFGGGPVVVPLLREYVVGPGWVAPRDFLIGLAIIQAFPGPNFNFAVYLGALSMLGTGYSPVLGALLGFVGMFTPGLVLTVGLQGFWRKLRTKPIFIAGLSGINATAVGLVFTAVYRLWQIGYLSPEASLGQSLAGEPWWVVVTVITYAESAWFKVPPAPAIILGAILGLLWYVVTGSH